MTQNFFDGLSALFTQVWRIFTSIKFPGTNFTFAHLLCFLIFVPLALGFFKSILGFGGISQGGSLARASYYKDSTPRRSK